MTTGGLIYLIFIGVVILFLIYSYWAACNAAGTVDSWFQKPPADPPPSFAFGRWAYNLGYGEKRRKKKEEERRKNIELYERLKREGKLH